MDMGLKGKVAIVGGASRGIGKASALGLAREGANVAICGRNPVTLAEAATEIRNATSSEVLEVPGDLTKHEDIKNLVARTTDQFGRLDILVNNSGGPPQGTALEADDAQWYEGIEGAMMFFVRTSREAVPHMRKQGAGRIINILTASVRQPEPHLMLSGAARMGVVGFAKALSEEVAGDNILVNNVCPGAILTERLKEILERQSSTTGLSIEDVTSDLEKNIPLRRIGMPEDLANMVVFLASGRAAYITGTTMLVDGGLVKSV